MVTLSVENDRILIRIAAWNLYICQY